MIKTFCAFAGYGGSEFALKQAGIESKCVGFSEIDKYAIQCFNQNFPNVKNYGSITDIDWKAVPDFDLITGGFPCQDVSVAGKQDLDKGRTILGLELTKALIEKQPKWFLFENVKGLMSKRFDEFRSLLIKSWEEAGYVVIYKVLNSKHYGIPQNRERVWFVGIRKDIYKPFEFQFPEPEPLKLLLKDILEDEVGEKYYLSQEQTEKLLKSVRHTSELQTNDYSNTLASRDYKSPKCIYEMSNRVYNINGVGPTLTKVSSGNQEKKIAIPCLTPERLEKRQNGRRFKEDEDGMFTLNTQDKHRVYNNHQIRKLTPKECFRLMGFFDDSIKLDGLSDTQKYRLAGNGWCLRPASDILHNLIR